MTAPVTLADAEERLRAATGFDKNIVVAASAGTGKTSLLVERILNAVGSGRYRLEEMAAVTFTRKAAAEMRNRLAAALEALRETAAEGAPPAAGSGEAAAARSFAWLSGERRIPGAEIARRSLEALGDLERFSVSTIHAFCAEILRAFPVEAGVDPEFRQDEGSRFEELFEREWSGFLEEELGPGSARAAVWRRALEVFSPGDLGRAARALSDFGAPDPSGWAVPGETPLALLAPVVRTVLDGARDLRARAQDLNPRFDQFLSSVIELARSFLDGEWPGGRTGAPAGLAFDPFAKNLPELGKKASGIDRERAAAFAGQAQRLLRSLGEIEEEDVAALLEPVATFVPRFREAALREGWVSFDGLLTLTRNLLRDHPGVRRALQRRFRHLLVDEFQDTSPIQYEILFFLAESEEAETHREAWKAPLAPGRLFIVGDPKQSIYRFLQADMAAYHRAVQRIVSQGGERVRLATNFRSEPPLIEALNVLFEQGFPTPGDSTQPPYQPMGAVPGRQAKGARIEIWSTGSHPRRAPERRQAEARAIAAWVAEHAGPGREFPLSRTAILFRAATQIGIYLEELRRAGVPLVVEGGREFMQRAEVRHLRALLCCLARPHDAVALAAVLRSPLGGLSDRDLAEMARLRHGWRWIDGGEERLSGEAGRALRWLRSLEREVRHLPADEQALRALERSRLELVEAAQPDGAQALANLRRYALAVADAAREQGLSLEQAIRSVAASAEEERAGVEESPLADETLEAVRVLTVHKAKGLEFDAVIVADLCRGEGSARGRGIEIGWSRGEGGGLAVRTPRGLNARRILHEREEALHEEAEALRTFYVACTRARRCLILVAGPVDADAADRPWPAALKAWGYDARQPPAGEALPVQGVRHVDVDGRRAPAAGVVGSIPSCEEEVSRFSRAAQAAGSGARVRERTPSGLAENRWEARERREGPTVPQPEGHGAALGRALHRALERWDGKGDGAGALEEALGRTAAETGPSSIALEREARALWDSVRRSFIPGLLREGAVLGREIPILMEDDGVVWYGSVDLLYREAGGAWVVVDYKTEDPGSDPELQARRFLPQLRVYARAIRKAAGISPRAEIFWVRTGGRSVLPAEDL